MQILYIDPGAGSIIIQSIIAGVLGFIFVIKTYWIKIKGFFQKNYKKEDELND